MKKKKILIWGTGQKGENAYWYLYRHRKYKVIAFGDNNIEKQGDKKLGLIIIGTLGIQTLSSLDSIVIASAYKEEIRRQLIMYTDVPIYNSIEELMYTRISIDIAGFCNAKCNWCVTGRKNSICHIQKHSYMAYDDFCNIYNHIYKNGLIEKSTEIMMYNWGEPLLNKDYVQIVEFLAEQEQTFSISTNASKVQEVQRKDAYKDCCAFVFSMSGFSQKSYDHIHGFNFEKIKNNIIKLSDNIYEHGFCGDGSISFHVYRFNHDEIIEAKKFSDSLGLRFNPYYPYFNGNSMTEEFLENRMEEKILQEANEQLHLSHVEGLLKKRPKDYRCFLENMFFIDCSGNIVLCCAADSELSDYQWESIYHISSFEQMREKRRKMLQCRTCEKCRELGIDYWMENNPSFKF